MNDKIRAGDLVLVSYTPGEHSNNPAHKFNGQEFVVKTVHRVNESKNSKITRAYYELYAAVSKFGVPYAFLEDELIKL